MTISEASRIAREALWMALLIGGPALLVTALVGTIVSLFQAVTQIHEQTLTFLPKFLAIMLLLAVGSGWMAEQMVNYSKSSFHRMSYVSE